MGFPVRFRPMAEPFRDFLLVLRPHRRTRFRVDGLISARLPGSDFAFDGSEWFERFRASDRHCAVDVLASAAAVAQSRHLALLSGYVFHGEGLLGLEAADVDRLNVDDPGSREAIGNFVWLELRNGRGPGDLEVDVRSDPFGLQPLYLLESGRYRLISNRYHLIALAGAELGLLDGVDVSRFGTGLFADSVVAMQIATQQLPIRSIQMLGPGAAVRIRRGQLQISYPAPAESATSYEELLHRGIDELVTNTRAVLNEQRLDRRYLNLTGGLDSRTILAAFRHLGATKELSALTWRLDDEEDFEIAIRLAAQTGLRYPPAVATGGAFDPHEHLELWRSLLLGLYHDLGTPHHRVGPEHERAVRLVGGCGELYRGVYHKVFPKHILDLAGSEASEAVTQYISDFAVWDLLASIDKARTVAHVRDEIMAMPGTPLREKLDGWYFHYRNRFHFGAQTAMARHVATLAISPLMAPSLRIAALRLPHEEREAGRVAFDVMRYLDPEVSELPLAGGGWKGGFAESLIHRSFACDADTTLSRWAGTAADTEGLSSSTLREDWFAAGDATIRSAREFLVDAGPEFAFAASPDLTLRLGWLRQNRPKTFGWWISRLATAADSVALAGR